MIKVITIICLTFLLALSTALWMDSMDARVCSMIERIELLEAKSAAEALPRIQVNRASIYTDSGDIWVETQDKKND